MEIACGIAFVGFGLFQRSIRPRNRRICNLDFVRYLVSFARALCSPAFATSTRLT